MRHKSVYKKPKGNNKALFATIRIVITFAVLAVVGMIGYFAVTQGWEAVFAWFGGKYACMVVVILLVAGTAVMWLWKLVRSMGRFKDDE